MFLLFRRRTLHVHIVSVFLVLITISSACIIFFTYARETRSIFRLAKTNILYNGQNIQQKVRRLLYELALTPQKAAGFYHRHSGIQEENTALADHCLNIVKYTTNVYSLFLATPDGSFLGAYNLEWASKTDFFRMQNQIPVGAVFALILLDRTPSSSKEVWTYYDQDLNPISKEEIASSNFDPRITPWYQGATKAKGLYWTDLFQYEPSHDPGIAVGMPLYHANGELSAVIGTDLPLDQLSNFLADQKIGSLGKVYLADQNGQILLPPGAAASQPYVSAAFAVYKKGGSPDVIFKINGNRYLGSIKSFPVAKNQEWSIVVLDPFSDFFGDIFSTQIQAAAISFLILILASLLVIHFSKEISTPIVNLAREVRKIQHLELESQSRTPSQIIEVNLLDNAIASMRTAIRSFSRYVPKEVVKQLVEHGKEIVLGGENKQVTIFFSDITNFTGIASTLTPDEINSMLKDYFAILSNLILSHHGTIDKYLGDGIMAFWGMPEEIPNPTATACIAALVCQEELGNFNQRQKEKGAPQLLTRIGINLGQALVGNIGTEERMNYTALGDIVNTTSHLQTLNKKYRTRIILGQEAVQNIGPDFVTRPLDHLELKGKKGRVKIYELGGMAEGPLSSSGTQKELFALFAPAYTAFHENRHEEAKTLFLRLFKQFPDDYPTQYYLEKLNDKPHSIT